MRIADWPLGNGISRSLDEGALWIVQFIFAAPRLVSNRPRRQTELRCPLAVLIYVALDVDDDEMRDDTHLLWVSNAALPGRPSNSTVSPSRTCERIKRPFSSTRSKSTLNPSPRTKQSRAAMRSR